jgi:hypothetical protein
MPVFYLLKNFSLLACLPLHNIRHGVKSRAFFVRYLSDASLLSCFSFIIAWWMHHVGDIMNNRTRIALLFLGNLLLLLGFFFLPWYIAPFQTHENLLEGPSAWNLMTFPFVATVRNRLGGFIWTIPFWLLAALIIFEVGGEIWTLWRSQRISPSRLYKNIGQIGLLWIVIIFILSCLNFAGFGWRSILINVSGLGFWSCLIGFLLIGVTRLPLLSMQRVSTRGRV